MKKNKCVFHQFISLFMRPIWAETNFMIKYYMYYMNPSFLAGPSSSVFFNCRYFIMDSFFHQSSQKSWKNITEVCVFWGYSDTLDRCVEGTLQDLLGNTLMFTVSVSHWNALCVSLGPNNWFPSSWNIYKTKKPSKIFFLFTCMYIQDM